MPKKGFFCILCGEKLPDDKKANGGRSIRVCSCGYSQTEQKTVKIKGYYEGRLIYEETQFDEKGDIPQ